MARPRLCLSHVSKPECLSIRYDYIRLALLSLYLPGPDHHAFHRPFSRADGTRRSDYDLMYFWYALVLSDRSSLFAAIWAGVTIRFPGLIRFSRLSLCRPFYHAGYHSARLSRERAYFALLSPPAWP